MRGIKKTAGRGGTRPDGKNSTVTYYASIIEAKKEKVKMNRNKYQLEVCKAMLSKDPGVGGAWLSDDEFAVSVDGVRAFVFDRKDIIFDANKIQREFPDSVKVQFSRSGKDMPLLITNKIRREPKLGAYLIQLESADGSFATWARNTYIQDVDQFHLYASGPIDRILVVDAMGRTVGLVLTVRGVE